MSERVVYLVIGSDREVRVAKRPRIASGEVAIAITLKFPDTWGRVIDHLAIQVPDFVPEVVESEE